MVSCHKLFFFSKVSLIDKMCKISDRIRSIYQYGYFAVRLVHRLLTYPIHSCFVLFIIYLQIMDVILYFQIRSRGPLLSITTISNQTISHLFDSLPVKKIMVGQTVSRLIDDINYHSRLDSIFSIAIGRMFRMEISFYISFSIDLCK